jgi:hypothetical protein
MGREADDSPEWSTWQWDKLLLPELAFSDAEDPGSTAHWLSTSPHHSNSLSLATAELIFLSLGLLVYNLSIDPNESPQRDMWLTIAVAIGNEIDQAHQIMWYDHSQLYLCSIRINLSRYSQSQDEKPETVTTQKRKAPDIFGSDPAKRTRQKGSCDNLGDSPSA